MEDLIRSIYLQNADFSVSISPLTLTFQSKPKQLLDEKSSPTSVISLQHEFNPGNTGNLIHLNDAAIEFMNAFDQWTIPKFSKFQRISISLEDKTVTAAWYDPSHEYEGDAPFEVSGPLHVNANVANGERQRQTWREIYSDKYKFKYPSNWGTSVNTIFGTTKDKQAVQRSRCYDLITLGYHGVVKYIQQNPQNHIVLILLKPPHFSLSEKALKQNQIVCSTRSQIQAALQDPEKLFVPCTKPFGSLGDFIVDRDFEFVRIDFTQQVYVPVTDIQESILNDSFRRFHIFAIEPTDFIIPFTASVHFVNTFEGFGSHHCNEGTDKQISRFFPITFAELEEEMESKNEEKHSSNHTKTSIESRTRPSLKRKAKKSPQKTNRRKNTKTKQSNATNATLNESQAQNNNTSSNNNTYQWFQNHPLPDPFAFDNYDDDLNRLGHEDEDENEWYSDVDERKIPPDSNQLEPEPQQHVEVKEEFEPRNNNNNNNINHNNHHLSSPAPNINTARLSPPRLRQRTGRRITAPSFTHTDIVPRSLNYLPNQIENQNQNQQQQRQRCRRRRNSSHRRRKR